MVQDSGETSLQTKGTAGEESLGQDESGRQGIRHRERSRQAGRLISITLFNTNSCKEMNSLHCLLLMTDSN